MEYRYRVVTPIRHIIIATVISVVSIGIAAATVFGPSMKGLNPVSRFFISFSLQKICFDPSLPALDGDKLRECIVQAMAVDTANASAYWGFGSMAVGLLTLAAVIYGFKLTNEAQKQAEITQKAEFRSYLSVDVTNFAFQPNATAKIDFVFQNYGRTPARNISGKCEVYIDYGPNKPVGETKIAIFSIDAVHPGLNAFKTEDTRGGFSDTDRITNATARLVMNIQTKYMDVFGIEYSENSVCKFSGVDSAAGCYLRDYTD